MSNDTPLSVVWTTPTQSFETVAKTNDEAIQLLKKAESDAAPLAVMVEFFDEASGLAFSIGVGSTSSVVTFQESLDPPYFISIGHPEAQGGVEFCYGNEPSEYLASNAMPNTDALDALEWFMKHRTRPPQVNWEKL